MPAFPLTAAQMWRKHFCVCSLASGFWGLSVFMSVESVKPELTQIPAVGSAFSHQTLLNTGFADKLNEMT